MQQSFTFFVFTALLALKGQGEVQENNVGRKVELWPYQQHLLEKVTIDSDVCGFSEEKLWVPLLTQATEASPQLGTLVKYVEANVCWNDAYGLTFYQKWWDWSHPSIFNGTTGSDNGTNITGQAAGDPPIEEIEWGYANGVYTRNPDGSKYLMRLTDLRLKCKMRNGMGYFWKHIIILNSPRMWGPTWFSL